MNFFCLNNQDLFFSLLETEVDNSCFADRKEICSHTKNILLKLHQKKFLTMEEVFP